MELTVLNTDTAIFEYRAPKVLPENTITAWPLKSPAHLVSGQGGV